jgi:hypothetical protein
MIYGKIVSNGSTCTLFKTRRDTMNVFVLTPAHVFNPSTINFKIQVIGDSKTSLATPLYVQAKRLHPMHAFIDMAIAVLVDPGILNNIESLHSQLLLTYQDNNDIPVNTEVEIQHVNFDRVNVISSSIISTNFELGTIENILPLHNIPALGAFLELQLDAKKGLSGGLVVNKKDGAVLGMIVINSSIPTENKDTENCQLNTNKNLAIKMYYAWPWVTKVTTTLNRLTGNNQDKLNDILRFSNFESLTDDCTPVVNHPGFAYIIHNITSMAVPFRAIALLNIQKYLSSSLLYSDIDSVDSVPIKTTLNTNTAFVDWFESHPEGSTIFLRSYTYTDSVKNTSIRIDLNNNNSSICDWVFRGDEKASLECNFQAQLMNDDGSVTMSKVEKFTFLSSQTVDVFNNRSYPRTTFQVCTGFFSTQNSFDFLQYFGMDIPNEKLNFCVVFTRQPNGTYRRERVSGRCPT